MQDHMELRRDTEKDGNCPKETSDNALPLEPEMHLRSKEHRTTADLPFICEEHRKAFELLTPKGKVYIAAYLETHSLEKVREILGLKTAYRGVVAGRLQEHAKRMGLSSYKELVAGRETLHPKLQRPVKENPTNDLATAAELRELVEKQNYKCNLSGVDLTPDTAALDHIIPITEGGTNHISNLQWLDEQVNRAKGTMTQAAFIEMCNRVTALQNGKLAALPWLC